MTKICPAFRYSVCFATSYLCNYGQLTCHVSLASLRSRHWDGPKICCGKMSLTGKWWGAGGGKGAKCTSDMLKRRGSGSEREGTPARSSAVSKAHLWECLHWAKPWCSSRLLLCSIMDWRQPGREHMLGQKCWGGWRLSANDLPCSKSSYSKSWGESLRGHTDSRSHLETSAIFKVEANSNDMKLTI